jgi:N-methylhydantoinase A/oxoprolinase/acetone carboxylase beta subunit
LSQGGTNTDAVLACVRKSEHGNFTDTSIIAKHKASTSSDVTTGICEAIQSILVKTNISRRNVISVNIGTTHFINAVVQADSEKLNRVAVLRLCGPFCREVEPFLGFPPTLRAVVEGYVGYLSGGLESKLIL